MGTATNALALRRKVVEYLEEQGPSRVSNIAAELRRAEAFKQLRDADVRSVVLSMIVTGTLGHDEDLRIRVASSNDTE
jgi:hypothetical protein